MLMLMFLLLRLSLFLFVFFSSIETIPSVSFFYPKTIDELSCSNGFSWTKWFNSAHPINDQDFDRELVSVILQTSGKDMCQLPQSIQAQSVSPLTDGQQYSAAWKVSDGTIAGFMSRTPGIDFRVRFCCSNNAFIPTTTPLPRPITNPTCGRPEIQPSIKTSRIFGGQTAIPHSWPWQILYEEEKLCEKNRRCIDTCGGTIIDRYHVLTAAHCVEGKNLSKIMVTAGVHNRRNNEGETRQMRRVDQIFRHPDWNARTLANDLTILRLNKPVELNRYVQPVCLPGPDPQINSDVILIGWGAEHLEGSTSDVLQQTQVKVIGQCYKYWNQFDEENQICVAQKTNGSSACQGDSGGPLLQQSKDQWVLQGVASFIDTCKTDGQSLPNVYIKVSAYLTWIEKTIRQ